MTAKNELTPRDFQPSFELMERIAGTFARPSGERDHLAGELASNLKMLRAELDVHFHREEAKEGLFGQLVEQAPRVAHAVGKLRDEHRAILLAVRRLADGAQHLERPGQWTDAERQFNDLHRKLRLLETHENDLLQEVYLRDVPAED